MIVSDTGYLQGYILCCVMYFIICFPLAMLITWLEKRSKRLPKVRHAVKIPASTKMKEA